MNPEGVFTGGLPSMKCCGSQMQIETVGMNGEDIQWKRCNTCSLIFHARKLWLFVDSHVAEEWVHGPCANDCSGSTDCSSKICSTREALK